MIAKKLETALARQTFSLVTAIMAGDEFGKLGSLSQLLARGYEVPKAHSTGPPAQASPSAPGAGSAQGF